METLINAGKNWLLNCQDGNGCWTVSGEPSATTTVLALDAINLAEQFEATIYSFMRAGMREAMKYKNISILYTSDREKIAIDNVIKKRKFVVSKNNAGDLFYTTVSLKNGVLVQIIGLTNQGQAGPGAASNTTYSVAVNINPDAIIMGGICFGFDKEAELGEEKVKLGDVLISQRIWDYEYQCVMDDPNDNDYRGDILLTSQNLLRLFRRETPKGFNTKIGLMASGNKLVKSPDFKKKLLKKQPKLIGGDMEGYSVTSVCCDKLIDCIMIKGVSDLGDALKDDNTQIEAATNAFTFIFSSIESIVL